MTSRAAPARHAYLYSMCVNGQSHTEGSLQHCQNRADEWNGSVPGMRATVEPLFRASDVAAALLATLGTDGVLDVDALNQLIPGVMPGLTTQRPLL